MARDWGRAPESAAWRPPLRHGTRKGRSGDWYIDALIFVREKLATPVMRAPSTLRVLPHGALPTLSAAWRPSAILKMAAGPMALRPRLATGLPFRG